MSERHLTPAECGARLGVSGRFIRDEINDGRLTARIFRRTSGRSVYRIDPADFDVYVVQHWPKRSLQPSA